MKKLLRLSVFLFAAAFARADVVIEQAMDSQFAKGSMVMKIKGDKARIDMPGPTGSISVIMDMQTSEMATLMHQQKMAVKMNLAEAKKTAEASQKAAGVDMSKIEKPKSTGQREKIGTWDCEIFEFKIGDTTSKMWVAKDFPNAKVIMAQMNKINSAASSGMGFDPSKFELDGMTVKSETNTAGGPVTTTLVKVSEDPVADSEFVIPADYSEMKMPTGN